MTVCATTGDGFLDTGLAGPQFTAPRLILRGSLGAHIR